MNKEQLAQDLLKRYRKGTCTDVERAIVDAWLDQELLRGTWDIMPLEKEKLSAQLKLQIDRSRLVKVKWHYPWAKPALAAAVALVIFGAGLFYFNLKNNEQVVQPSVVKNDKIIPGGKKATLRLANGKTINLSDQKSGLIVGSKGINYLDGDTLESGHLATSQTLMASTPRGGVYEFILPDGTKAMLNAATVLKFPSVFPRKGNRTVELVEGEAFFEVTKDRRHPFIVTTKGQEVEVLGTHFNINAYENEDALRTTLVEGSVRVNKDVILKPGQQSILKNDKIKVADADIEAVMAWKNGVFIFNTRNFESTMNMIARWYDVEIIYDYKPVNLHIGGEVSRTRSITEVLRTLQETDDVKFKIEGRRIRVIK